jgi:hypothetical protein
MNRGKQYTRAIRLYYRKFGTYPPNVDALVKTNEIRFLRTRYLGPTTGQDDWKPILLGQNKTPLAMGFFGKPLNVAGFPFPGDSPHRRQRHCRRNGSWEWIRIFAHWRFSLRLKQQLFIGIKQHRCFDRRQSHCRRGCGRRL